MARVTGVSASEWLQHITQPHVSAMLVRSATGSIMNPTNALAVGSYQAAADAAAGAGSAPLSVFEGLQTIADLSRTSAGFNPLDPTGTGDKAHFLQFSQNVADAPMLSLLTADTKTIQESSTDASKLIQAFVNAFTGIASENIGQITQAVTSLANAALSYSDKQESYSNFAQNLLQTNSAGNVEFHLYSSTFQIHKTEQKGIVTLHSNYQVLSAVYQLSTNGWASIRDLFNQQQKTSTNDWINNMKTPVKAAGGARALCLERALRLNNF